MIRNQNYYFSGIWKSPWILNKWSEPLPDLKNILVVQDTWGTHSYQYIVEIKTRKRKEYDKIWQALQIWKDQIPQHVV